MTLQGALALAGHGVYVLPCAPTKRPLTGHGVHDATRDQAVITQWWRDWPFALVGVACGQSGLICLDFDCEEVYKKFVGDYPDLPTSSWLDKTPRGYHIWYKVPDGLKIKSVASPLPAYQGLDIRADGGYAIVYNPGGYVEPAMLPPGLLLLFKQHGVVKEDPQPPGEPIPASATPKKQCVLGGDYWLKQALDRAFVGNRNETGFWLACQLRDAGYGMAEAAHYMREFQRSVSTTKEPYTMAEALASLRSAYNGSPRMPVVLQKQNPDDDYYDKLLKEAGKRIDKARIQQIEAMERRTDRLYTQEEVKPKEWRCYTTNEDYPPPAWIVKDWIPLNGVTIIHSEPGCGKTLLMQYMMVRVALGRGVFPPRTKSGPAGEAPVNDLEELPVTRTPCVMLQLDQAPSITGNRFKWFRLAEGLSPEDSLDVYFYAPHDWVSILDPDDNLTLRMVIKKHDARLVVIDTLAAVSSGVPENSDEMKRVMAALGSIAKDLQCAIVVLHHDRKEYTTQGGGAQQKIRGHTSIPAGCEISIGLSKPDPNGRVYELTMDKNRLGDKQCMYVEWSYAKHPDTDETLQGRFYRVEPEKAEDAREATIKAAILEILSREGEVRSQEAMIGLTMQRLKKAGVRAGEKMVVRAINKLVDDEKIRVEYGRKNARIFKLSGGE